MTPLPPSSLHHLLRIPLLLHALIETSASVTFLLSPASQLAGASLEAKLILRSYGALLLATSILSIFFFVRPEDDEVTAVFAAAMSFYHLFPIYRAGVRMRRGFGRGEQVRVLGGAGVHLVVHLGCLVGLLGVVLGVGRGM